MGKKSTPPAPDYRAAAEETATANLDMAKYQTNANRIDQYNPYGSLTYAQDANGNWSQFETYDPRIQAALDSQIGVQQGLSDQANSMLGTVKDAYSKDFNAPSWDSYLAGLKGVNTDSLGKMGQFGSDASINTDVNGAFAGNAALNQYFGRFNGDGSRVNTDTPQYTGDRQDQYSKAAYEASMALMRGDLDQQDERVNNRLALQGLTPGSEASNNALSTWQDGRSRQLNSLVNQSVLTGNEMNNRDYLTALQGFQAGNQAEGQRFGQDLAGFTTNRDTGVAENSARGQDFAQALAKFTTGNDANLQQLGLDQTQYDNLIKQLTMNAGLQDAENKAQNQDYTQALQNYGVNWQQEQTLRNMPLNELNALLSGQQVQNPTFEAFAQQGYVPGVDYSGAAAAKGAYDTNAYNAKMANRSGLMGTLGKLGGAMLGGPMGAMIGGSLFGGK